MPNILLKAEQLGIGYQSSNSQKAKILDNVNLSLERAEMLCLLGRNGTGKSTLLRTLAGLQEAIEGTVLINKKTITKLRKQELAKMLSLVLTEKVQAKHLKVRHILEIARYPYTGWLGKLQSRDKYFIEEGIALTQIESLVPKNLSELSDGEKQKVMIARALAQNTPLILLDEPTMHLDFANRLMIFELLKTLVQKQQKTILLSTHEIPLALKYADRILLINNKKQLIESSTKSDALLSEIEKTFGVSLASLQR